MKAPDPKDYPNSMAFLQDITSKLRGPEGCPWDKEQTHSTLVPYLIEESQEVVEAILKENEEHMKEELGDLLFQVVLHSQIASERRSFDLDAVAKDVAEKLVLRHPHVFDPENEQLSSADEVLANWDRFKEKEKQLRQKTEKTKSILSEVPETFPSLLKAEKFQKKASKAGFDWNDIKGVEEKLTEELNEFLEEIRGIKDPSSNQIRIEEELGDLLFTIVNLGRKLGVSAESALTRTNSKFKNRIEYIETRLQESDRKFSETPLEDLDILWNQAKQVQNKTSSNPLEEKQSITSDLIRVLSSFIVWKPSKEAEWPKAFLFTFQSAEYSLVFSAFGSMTLLPNSDPWGRKAQPIFYLNLSDPNARIWEDLSGNSYKTGEDIHEAILGSIRSYKKALAGSEPI
ncbi:nucleoside triphosphate pyrophosphohydrolase [Leptospira sarikeiensis]|uniref:Nucleoside triphosphate pyrophosphohydrolase n=1 Tax=Leptospira sarikeiensis TaxID=2484943 RepID=A0A4R9K888_9LEPT|nr:nucleoside triphosphate pyrophosphohydrolase [Leptospira sarikeiensis]TGL60854.1 nucleoside triphosphate pyrophosphohydrolase [Leptospira sarikeiensis]